jgi:hypothetical protein
MAYSRTTWENSPSTDTPLSADNLNNIETGILGVESSVSSLAGTVGILAGTAGTAVNITSTQGSVAAANASLGSVSGTVSSHLSATTSVHGITNTANLVYTDNVTLGSVSTISASLGSVAGTVTTNTAAIGSVSGTVTDLVTTPMGTVTGNYIIQLGDAGKFIKSTSSTAVIITLPPNGSVGFPIGQSFDVMQMGTGTVTFGTAASGTAGTVTILCTPSLILRTQYSAATIIKTDTNEWSIMGDMF